MRAKALALFWRLLAPRVAPERRPALCWVSPDGFVQLPEAVIRKLGVQYGGGVAFFTNKVGETIVMGDEEFFRMFEDHLGKGERK